MKILDKLLPEKQRDKKRIYTILGVLALGIFLMSGSVFKGQRKEGAQGGVSPQLEANPSVEAEAGQGISYEAQLEQRLKSILKKMQGVGEVEVMITTTYGKELVLAEDVTSHGSTITEADQEGGTRETNNYDEQKKIVMQNRNVAAGNEPVVIKEKQPEIQGVLVIAQGAGSSSVKQSIIQSAQTLLGVPAHRVSVHPMQTNANKK